MALASLLLAPRFVSFLPCLSLLVPVIDPDPDRRPNIHKTDISACHSTFRLCCVRVGSVLVGAWFWEGEVNSDTSAYIGGANVHTVEHKLFTCCDIFVVICVDNTAELLKKRLISSPGVEIDLTPLIPREPRILWIKACTFSTLLYFPLLYFTLRHLTLTMNRRITLYVFIYLFT